MKYVSYHISVTQKHIDAAEHHCGGCPVALSLSEFFGVKVHVSKSAIGFPTLAVPNIALPPEVRMYVRHFDNGVPFDPFDFYFTISEKTKEAIDAAAKL
jgi:hypothetical protein